MRNQLLYKHIGKVLIVYSILLICPLIVSIINREHCLPFIIPLLISLILGLFLNSLKVKNRTLYAKDGFVIVAISWILISILGAIPFIIGLDIPFYDAFFESVSGFTTTGATIFENVENLSNSILVVWVF